MRYSLYSGAGNTFAITDEPISPENVAILCEEHAIDGVIFGEDVFRMRIFNRDGSEAEMCGNGLRCFVKNLIEQNIHQERYEIETLAGTHIAWANGDQICVKLPPPQDFRWNLSIPPYHLHHLNTGVPHAVLFVESVDEIDLTQLGPSIRYHSLFPEGVNVNVVDPISLQMRTYERGVEAETLACGTGAVASALALAKQFGLPSPISMEVKSGEKLNISFTSDWQTIIMEGPANRVEVKKTISYTSPPYE